MLNIESFWKKNSTIDVLANFDSSKCIVDISANVNALLSLFGLLSYAATTKYANGETIKITKRNCNLIPDDTTLQFEVSHNENNYVEINSIFEKGKQIKICLKREMLKYLAGMAIKMAEEDKGGTHIHLDNLLLKNVRNYHYCDFVFGRKIS